MSIFLPKTGQTRVPDKIQVGNDGSRIDDSVVLHPV